MGKILFWVLLGVAAWFAWQAWQRADRARLAREAREAEELERRERDAAATAQVAGPEAMVRCARCGVHLPRSEAVADGGELYCGAAHRQAARDAAGPGSGPDGLA